MALANAAWILSSTGRNVLIVDWAIGAQRPSVDQYLAKFFADEEVPDEQEGLLDLLLSYRKAHSEAVRRDPDPDLDVIWRRQGGIGRHIVELNWPQAGIDTGLTGKLAHLGPGRRADDTYWAEAERLDWELFAASRHGRHFLASLREDLVGSGYDYVLLDNHSGRSTLARLGVVHLADVLMACFRLGHVESISDGARVTQDLRKLTAGRDAGPVTVLPVPMGDDHYPADDIKRFAHLQYGPLLEGLDEIGRERYWGKITVPRSPSLWRHPVIAAIAQSPHEQGTALKAYEAVAQAITGDPATELRPLPEPSRRALERHLTAKPATAGFDVAIFSCAADAPWADWITWVLRRAGLTVRAGGGDAPAETSVVLLSPRLLESSELDPAMGLIADLRSGSGARADQRLVGVRVSEGTLGEILSSVVDVDLVPHGPDDATARRELLTYFTYSDRLVPRADDLPDAPRFPKRVPRVQRVRATTRSFVGRDAVLRSLREKLRDNRGTGRPTVLTGPTGIGKSSVAAEYACLFAYDYDVIWWISAEEQREVRTRLARLLPHLREGAAPDAQDAVEQTLAALRGGDHGRWLLVYDAAGDPLELERLMPDGGPGEVLVTSRHEGWAAAGHSTVPVGRFERGESVRLFRERIGQSDVTHSHAERVARRLDDHPLAVDQAAGWVTSRWIAAQEEKGPPPLDRTPGALADQLLDLLGDAEEITTAPAGEEGASAARTAGLSLERLARERPAALWLVRICAYLASDGVAMELVRSAGMRERIGRHDPDVGVDLTVDEVVQMVKRYSLVRVDQQLDRLQVHPHTLRTVRAGMSEDERVEARASAQLALAAFVAGDDASRHVQERRHRESQRHVRACEVGETADAGPEVRAWAVQQVRYLYMSNDWEVGRALAEQLRVQWTADFGESDRHRLELLIQLANVQRELGMYERAAHWDAEAQRLREESLPSNHLLGLRIRRSVAADLRARGAFVQALLMDQQTLEAFKERLGEEHPDTLRAANNLALAFLLTGAAKAAMELDRTTYETRRRILGEQAPATWHSMVRLAIDYREMGEYANARSHLETALALLRASAGNASPTTLRAARALAVTLRDHGEAEEALGSITETWHASQAFYGPHHPETLSCVVSLAATQAALGRYGEALRRGRLNLALYRETFSPSHPFTLACHANLGVYARLAGRLDEARRSGEEAWRALHDDADVGPEHPFTLGAEIGYANALVALGETEAAAERERHAYAGFKQRLGPGHPLSRIAYTNLHVTEDARADADGGDGGLRRDIDLEIPST
nr:hypothetical protein GCM10010200_022540 [Actinomadura rugatobispora]